MEVEDLNLLHMAINQQIRLLTCEQITLCAMLKMTQNYEFNKIYKTEGLLEASSLFKCVDKSTNQEYALKLLRIDEFDSFAEIYLHTANIESINQVIKIIHENQFVFILFESAVQDLHSYIRTMGPLDEHRLYCLFNQIVRIIDQLHQRGVILNDIKLRKFVFIDTDRTKLKLECLDGSTVFVTENYRITDQSTNHFGCPIYQAPERLINDEQQQFDLINGQQSDCYSLGVMLYTMAFARYPFHNIDLELLKDQILSGIFEIPETTRLSLSFIKLIRSLLSINPKSRPTTRQIIENDNWFNKNTVSSTMHDDLSDQSSYYEYYSKFSELVKETKKSIQLMKKTIDDNCERMLLNSMTIAGAYLIPVVNYSEASQDLMKEESPMKNDMNNSKADNVPYTCKFNKIDNQDKKSTSLII